MKEETATVKVGTNLLLSGISATVLQITRDGVRVRLNESGREREVVTDFQTIENALKGAG